MSDTEELSEEERLAAEWAALAEDSGDVGDVGGGGGSTRVLNQDEIDSLLGFDQGGAGDGDNSGIMALVNSALVNYERLPMLEVVFDRLVRMMSTSLRNFTSDNVEVSLDQISSVRFGDYLNSIPLPAMLSVFKAEEWDNYGLMVVDSALIYSIVDVLLGGRRGTAAMRIEGRPYTTIERNLVERMVHVVLSDLSAAFDPLSPVTFRFDRLETNPRFATIARPANAAVLVKLRIDMEDRGGRLELMIPYATLEPVRELLLQMFMGEKFGRDFDLGNPLGVGTDGDRCRSVRRARRGDDDAARRAELARRHPHPAERDARRRHRTALRRRVDVPGPHGPQGRAHRRAAGKGTAQAGGHAAMSPMVSLILDLVIVGLLAATIAYAIILNKQIIKLRESRGEMAELIQGLNEAMTKAETGVRGLKKTASDTGEDLQRTVNKAQTLRDELQFMIEAADTLATRLGNVGDRDGGRSDGGRGSAARIPVKPALAPRPLARPMAIETHDDDHDDAPPPPRLEAPQRRAALQEAREPQPRDPQSRDPQPRDPMTRDGESLSRAERELLQAIENAGKGVG